MPTEFEFEMEDNGEEGWVGDNVNGEPIWVEKFEPKTITLPNGRPQAVGRYL